PSCRCGSLLSPDHFLSCTRLRRRAVTGRHDLVLRFLSSFLHGAGFVSELELPSPNRLRPDLRTVLDGTSLLLDVSIVHPFAPSLLPFTASPLGAARQRELEKLRKYDRLALDEGASFVPFVLESTGALGESAQRFVQLLASRALAGEFASARPVALSLFLSRA